MKIIETEHGLLYRAEIGKKVRYKNTQRLYSEILVLEETDKIEEVEEEQYECNI